jgi:YHS domain-containing protein
MTVDAPQVSASTNTRNTHVQADCGQCRWCDAKFGRRRGGKPQKFCSRLCKTRFESARIAYVDRGLAEHTIGTKDLQSALAWRERQNGAS